MLVSAMSDLEIIQSAVGRAANRRRWLRAWRGFWQGLVVGALIWFLALVCYKSFPISYEIVLGAAIIAFGSLIFGFIRGWLRSMSLSETARWIDEQQKLQERLGTAMEMASAPPSNWRDLLLSDAAGHARSLDARRLLPLSLPVASRWALLILALGAGLGFLPEYRSKAFVQKQNEKAVIKEAGKQLSDLSRRNLTQRPPALEKTKENLETIEQLGNQMVKANLTRGDALKQLASASDKLKDDLKELGRNPALKPLDRAARETSKAGGANVPAELQKQIDSLQKSLGDKASDPDALDKLKNELQKAQQAAAGMPGANSPENAAAKQQLAQSLANLAQQAKEMGVPLANLEEAIAALQANQTDTFLKDLNAAVNDLEKLQQMAKALQQLQQQAASKVGKDLAEQLKNGQADAAQKTLEKMVAQLKQSNLSAEQIKKLLEEVSKAVDPAGEYGKVKDLLSQAAGQMKQGEKPGAAQSLADAAKELEKLLQQLGDAQSLQATLEALKKAQMCVGNGQSWAQCKNPGLGKGGKPGKGVGTWADETGWLYYPEMTERWDNSGKVRPDMKPRGLTDRGEGELADTLAPTKIKGQINPGGPMPSITLKGVSIKGQSKVGYSEAVNAAQSEAQSALNNDQVPKAYQGAVKNYFDDLKE
ncbi:MAG: hypothetical protein ABI042_19460 [Verrucomicrobiota bacterium]